MVGERMVMNQFHPMGSQSVKNSPKKQIQSGHNSRESVCDPNQAHITFFCNQLKQYTTL